MAGKKAKIEENKTLINNERTAGVQYLADVWTDELSIIFNTQEENPAWIIANKIVKEAELEIVDTNCFQFSNGNETLVHILDKGVLCVRTFVEDKTFSIDLTLTGIKAKDPTITAEILRNLTDEWKIDHVNQSPLVRGLMPNSVRDAIKEKKNPTPMREAPEDLKEIREAVDPEELLEDRTVVQLATPTLKDKAVNFINGTFQLQRTEQTMFGFIISKGGLTTILGKVLFLVNFTRNK